MRIGPCGPRSKNLNSLPARLPDPKKKHKKNNVNVVFWVLIRFFSLQFTIRLAFEEKKSPLGCPPNIMPLERKALKALRRQLKSDWRNAIGVKLSVGRDAPLADEPAMIRLLGREIDHILPEIFPAAAGAAFTPDSVRVYLGMLLHFTNFRVFDRISCQVLAWRDGDRILSCRFSNNNGPGSLVFNMHTHKQKPQNMICYAYNLTGSGTYQPDVTTALDIAQGLVPEGGLQLE